MPGAFVRSGRLQRGSSPCFHVEPTHLWHLKGWPCWSITRCHPCQGCGRWAPLDSPVEGVSPSGNPRSPRHQFQGIRGQRSNMAARCGQWCRERPQSLDLDYNYDYFLKSLMQEKCVKSATSQSLVILRLLSKPIDPLLYTRIAPELPTHLFQESLYDSDGKNWTSFK